MDSLTNYIYGDRKLTIGTSHVFTRFLWIDEILHLDILHHLDELAVQFDERFSDLKELKKHARVMNPFSAILSDVEYIEGWQEALIDLQSDDIGRHFFTHNGVNKFWLTQGKALHQYFRK